MILTLLILAAIMCRIAGPLPVDRPPLMARRLVYAALDDFTWRENMKSAMERGDATTLDLIEARVALAHPEYLAARVHYRLYRPLPDKPAEPRVMFADWSAWTRIETPVMGQPIARRTPGVALGELAGVAA